MELIELPEGVIKGYPVREINASEEGQLERIAEILDNKIENYEVTVLEPVFHQEYNEVCNVFEFENLKSGVIHSLVISPTYEIYAFSKQVPKSLLIDIHNCITDYLNTVFLRSELNNDVE